MPRRMTSIPSSRYSCLAGLGLPPEHSKMRDGSYRLATSRSASDLRVGNGSTAGSRINQSEVMEP